MTTDKATMIATWIIALTSLGTFVVAWVQLARLRKTIEQGTANHRLDALRVVLEIETQMNQRKVHFEDVGAKVHAASGSEALLLNELFNAAKESYFNALDRLCFCITKKYLDERDWKVEYRNLINDTIKAHESDFGPSSPYRHIKDLNHAWQRD